MIKTNKALDYGASLRRFSKQLEAVTLAKKETGEDYAFQLGRLQSASKVLLDECRETEISEAPTLLRYDHNPDDIPETLFQSPKTYKP